MNPQKRSLPVSFEALDVRLGQGRLSLLIIVILVIVIGLPLLFYPFGRDQGIHGYVAASWLEGQLPYKDVWVQKGPLTFLPHLMVIATFGRTEWAIRLLDLLWQIAICWLIFRIASRRLSNSGALLTVFFYLILYFAIDFWNTSHAEGFLLPFLLLAIDLYDRARLLSSSERRWVLLFFSGFSVAITPWFKQTSLVFVAGFFLWMTVDSLIDENKSLRLWLDQIVPFGAGVFTFTLIIALFLFSQEMLSPMLEVLRYSVGAYPNYVPINEIGEFWKMTFEWGSQRGVIIILFLIGLAILPRLGNRRPSWLGILIMAVAGLSSVYAQRRLWEYHWISTLPFIALFAAAATTVIAGWLSKYIMGKKKWVIVTSTIAFAFVMSIPLLETHVGGYERMVSYLFGWRDAESYLEDFGMLGEANMAEYLRQRTEDRDPIFIWGHYALLYYLTDRHNPTRFAMDPPLSLVHSQRDTWQAETILDLEADPPNYILVATGDITPFEPQPSKQQLANFPELIDYIEDSYYLVDKLPGFDVHVRQKPPEYSVGVSLGSDVTLLGYDLHSRDMKPGAELAITLHWRADGAPDNDYTVFVHLVNNSNPEIIAQSDSYPDQGRKPTSVWQTGDLILDAHSLILPDDLPSGQYELIVGMYQLETMERLPVADTTHDYIKLLEIP